MESDRKLRDMLASKNEPSISSLMPFIKDEYENFNSYSGNMQMPVANEYYNDKSTAMPIDAAYNSGDGDAYKWKCSKCPARFKTRQLLRTHRKIHGKFVKDDKPRMPLNNSSNHSAVRSVNVPVGHGVSSGGPIPSGHGPNLQVQQSAGPTLHQVQNKPIHMPINKDIDDKDTGEIMGHGPSYDASSTTKWKCNKCQKHFKTRAYLRKHRRNHGDQQHTNPAQNNLYGGSVSSAGPSLSGIVGASSGDNDKWLCNQCTGRFATQNLLREHKKMHHKKAKLPRPRPYPDVPPHIPNVPHVHAPHTHIPHTAHTPHVSHVPHAPQHLVPIPHVMPLQEPHKKNHL